MKTCQKCGKTNRNEASYCKWCGERLTAAADASAVGKPVAGGSRGTADPEAGKAGSVAVGMPHGMIAKECVREPLENFTKRCEQTAEFRKRTGSDARPGLDCIITGETGTGKTYLAGRLAQILYDNRISESRKPKTVDAADWDEFNSSLDENLAAVKTGVLVVTNCQNLVDTQGGPSELDKLFARMKANVNMPVVILCGLEDGFGTYISAESNALSLFEFRFQISSFKDSDLKALCVSLIRDRFRTAVSPEAEKRLGLVFKKMFRDGRTKENGILAGKVAEESAFNMFSRGGSQIEETDIPGEPFKELTEEQIMEKINAFTGLTEVKQEIKSIIDSIKRQKRDNPGKPVQLKSHFVFTGNPGTGKTTIARLFADILGSLQVLPSGHLVEVMRKDLVSQYVGDTALKTERVINSAMGGILFIDEAYSLKQGDDDKVGQEAIDTLLPYLENRAGDFVCIIAGYTKEMTTFLRSNPGLDSRFKKKIGFKDYNGKELTEIFLNMVAKKGLTLTEEASEKVGKFFERMYLGRTDTFGNARDVRNAFDRSFERLCTRTAEMSDDEYARSGKVLTWEDIAGPDGTKEISVESVMKELDSFVGMESVKKALRELAEEMRFQQRRMEFGGKASIRPVNIILTGNPGTGKTSVARVLGKLFKAMGICQVDRVVEKGRKDIVSTYANESDKNMDKAVNEAMGGVLFIDEAYALAPFDDAGHCSDSEGIKALERLMVRMENDRGKFVVVCAGYKDKMRNLMKANEGFASRFTHRINIEDYTPEELTEIFRRMAEGQGYSFAGGTLDKALKAFRKLSAEKSGKDFGNAREARNMLDSVLGNIGARVNGLPDSQVGKETFFTILPEDIPYEEPKVASEEECLAELDSLIGLESVKKEIRSMLNEMRQKKMDSELSGRDFTAIVPDHYLFLGNPGTGKTTVARLMGRILYSLGVIARPDVIEVSRADMVAPYQGQTAPKTRETIDRAMGGILFIDEAYSLIQGDNDEFGNESVTELLKLLEDRKGRFVCIAAGYTREMGRFLDSNSGLKSRFTKTITFEDYNPEELMDIFRLYCRKEGYSIDTEAEEILEEGFREMYDNRAFDFGNGRDVRNLFGKVKSAVAGRAYSRMKELIAEGADRQAAYEGSMPKTITKEDLL